jgi:hypothetical protein
MGNSVPDWGRYDAQLGSNGQSRRGEGMQGESLQGERLMDVGGNKKPARPQNRTFHSHVTAIAVFATMAVLLCCNVTFAAGPPKVILLRGWFGVFSTGLDGVATDLKAHGVDAEVAGHLNWQNEVTEILHERSAGRTGPLILIGHSQGANNVIDMARALESSHVPVDLLITLSPFMQNRVPGNVVKAVNYYQAPGWGQAIEAEPGFHGKLVNVNLADDPTISHIGIDKSTKIQTEILREISAVK